MATPLASDFTFFERTTQEARNGSILSGDNIIHIQNLLAMAAITYVNVESNPQNPQLAELQRAKLKGEIDAYRMLINTSRQAEQEVADEAVVASKLQEEKQRFMNSYAAFSNPNPTPVTVTTESTPAKEI